MLRKFLSLCCAVALAFPVYAAEAATQKPAKHKTVVKSKDKAGKHSVSSRRIIHTIRSDSKYRVRTVNYQPRHNVFVEEGDGSELRLASSKALIINQDTGEVLYAKSTDVPTPIASVTKLMTAMVVLDAHQPLTEPITISEAEVDTLKGTGSRLRVGTTLTRGEMLQLALMASENRAAASLGNAYPGGRQAFVAAMNAKAVALGMTRSRFVDGTGLNSENVSTAEDLAKMVKAAYQYPEIRQVTTTSEYEVPVHGLSRPVEFRNTNILVRNSDWQIGLSKTGFINEAGRCLVMQAQIADQPLIIVLLDSWGKFTRIGDAQRIRKWIESSNGLRKLG
ncbi:MAG TPA: D-alanyl-D-alanine endopeptidase [Methylophilaceae bacterium]|nr:D-alanyl-D-alanine endopeptidase [Methylophilaceae bacterium]